MNFYMHVVTCTLVFHVISFHMHRHRHMAEKPVKRYSKDDLRDAVKAVLNEGYTTQQMCEKFNIPLRTLQHNIK